ncbi:MAG: class I SAM-dependent methyltransferase [Acidimicrobiia bacterium]
MTETDDLFSARAVYDATAEEYARRVGIDVSSSFEGPVDRAVLAAFVEFVGLSAGLVADIGCGPGRVAAWLTVHGLDVVGVDVSHAMVTVARRAHPDIRFEDGCLTALPFEDGSLVGAVCWYSIIHTSPEHLRDVFCELERVLAVGGHLLVAFQAGDSEAVHRTDAYGTGHSLTYFRHCPEDVARSLVEAGLKPHVQAVRDPELDHESSPQAFIIARNIAPGR